MLGFNFKINNSEIGNKFNGFGRFFFIMDYKDTCYLLLMKPLQNPDDSSITIFYHLKNNLNLTTHYISKCLFCVLLWITSRNSTIESLNSRYINTYIKKLIMKFIRLLFNVSFNWGKHFNKYFLVGLFMLWCCAIVSV